MRWWRRVLRILDLDRIRLPRRPLELRDIRPGDRLQIGLELWRVCRTRAPSGSRIGSFALEAEEASVMTALLIAHDASGGIRGSRWTLIKGADRFEVPGEMIVVFPTGLASWSRKGGNDS